MYNVHNLFDVVVLDDKIDVYDFDCRVKFPLWEN